MSYSQTAVPTWKNVFNTDLSWGIYRDIDDASKLAKTAHYPFFLWNGRVYKTDFYYTHHQLHDICLAEDLK